MSLDSCRPLSPLSLSLTSLCLDLCLSRGGGGRVTRPPLASASGTRIQRGRPLQEGGTAFIYLFIGGSSAGPGCGTGRATSLWLAASGLTCSLEGFQGFGGAIVAFSDVYRSLLLSPPILTVGRNGQGYRSGSSTILSH